MNATHFVQEIKKFTHSFSKVAITHGGIRLEMTKYQVQELVLKRISMVCMSLSCRFLAWYQVGFTLVAFFFCISLVGQKIVLSAIGSPDVLWAKKLRLRQCVCITVLSEKCKVHCPRNPRFSESAINFVTSKAFPRDSLCSSSRIVSLQHRWTRKPYQVKSEEDATVCCFGGSDKGDTFRQPLQDYVAKNYNFTSTEKAIWCFC